MAKSVVVSSILIVLLMITRIYTCNANAAEQSYVDFVKETISSHPIVIFSKSYCGFCKRAKAVFAELNQMPFVVEIDQRDDGYKIQDALMEVVGQRTVPQVFINGQHIGGSTDTVHAYESGDLAMLLVIDPANKVEL
ncbi:hypothetical protein OSB04_020922 [Centaurea solstitialis]|uniref:Glutaredoxin domain-containing protein n=1 Tax=Centaurea solstitialis TaxID=347529 RepID=A0AA38SUU6_9ASTR|nr:hypothetical protein OSB04_020922 [Centaurea solstitialis]